MRYKYRSLRPFLLKLAVVSFLLLPILAFAETEAGFRFSIDGSSAVIEGYEGDSIYVVIPETLGGFPVSSVGEEALAELCADSVSLPRSIRSLRRGAFRGAKIYEIRFSHGLLEIGEEAFMGCVNLIGAALPETLLTLSGSAFKGCSSLLYVTLPESVRIEEDPFPDCPRLATLAMVLDHPTLMMDGNRLVSRVDSRVLSVLQALSAEDAHE